MYCELAALRGCIASQIVACTATADHGTLAEIQTCLAMQNPIVISMAMHRPNLSLFVARKHSRTAEADIVKCIRCSSAERVLVFCQRRNETERLVQLLTQNDISASVYHSAVSDRPEALRTFLSGMNQLTSICYCNRLRAMM
jgi:superfamily II DNA helicase RecQ